MFTESASLYDAVYRSLKDYQAEARQVASAMNSLGRQVSSVLDVGCGTGEHVLHFRRQHGLAADGIDLDPRLLALARAKVPEASFFHGDMARFRLGRRYDAVVCLFSAIGYVLTLDRLRETFRCFRDHLEADGIVLIEPWFGPGALRIGLGATHHVSVDGRTIERTSFTKIEGRVSRLVFEYHVRDAGGSRRFEEVHELGLFTEAETVAALTSAGFSARFDPVGPSGRGLFTAQPAA